MKNSASFLFLSLLLSLSPSSTSGQPGFRFNSCNNDVGNYSATGTFASNLNTVLSAITTTAEADKKFFNLTAGDNSGVDQVNAMALCRGDITSSSCQSCRADAARKILTLCPTQKEAIVWYNECFLRYSNKSIFGTADSSRKIAVVNTQNASDPVVFNQQLGTLLRQLQSEASAGDSRVKFADGGPAKVSDFMSEYGYVECTPDLSSLDCSNCINGLINYIPGCCDRKIGALIVNPSCNIRYDSSQFYNSGNDSLSPLPPSRTNATDSSSTGNGNSKGGKIVIAIVVSVVICLVLVAVIFACCFFRRKKWQKIESSASSSIHKNEDDIMSVESLLFDFSTVREATNNFSDANKLGRGGFGVVYKGTLSNGQQIAVKRLAKNSSQGEQEFKNEVLLVAKLQHRNLVRLLGFCLDKHERLLIYELLPNSSLDHFLFDPIKRSQLNWQMRHNIITGIARGLLYLHEDSQLRIVHRDLKASNVLLDAEMNAKISDFGMARLFLLDQTHGDTERVVGTYGYIAPEYALHGVFSPKSDVYSFGILVLEMMSGKRNFGMNFGENNSEDLITWVWRNWRDGTPMNVIDECIPVSSRSEILRCIHIGLLCVQEDPTDRPTISSIVVMLSSYSFTLPMPSPPAFVTRTLNLRDRITEEQSSAGIMPKHSTSSLMQKSVNGDSSSEFFPR